MYVTHFLCISSYILFIKLSACIPKEVSTASAHYRTWDSAWICHCMQELRLC